MNESHVTQVFEAATDKQLGTLELAADGLTSKQIAIELEVAPRTVDQRIDALRAQLDGMPRSDLVRYYRRWKDVCGRTTCDPFSMSSGTFSSKSPSQQKEAELVFRDAMTLDGRASWDRPGDWMRPGIEPSSLGPLTKVLAVFVGAFALLMGFALIVATAEGINSLASSAH